MNISDTGLSLIKTFEGFRTHVYPDTAGHPTIGYGHELHPGESFPNGVTDVEATELLRGDVSYAEHAVNTLVTVPVKQGQFDALVDFAYNLGAGTFRHSTLLRLLNQKQYEQAANQFEEWDRAGGVVSPGILRRREAEWRMFLG